MKTRRNGPALHVVGRFSRDLPRLGATREFKGGKYQRARLSFDFDDG